MNNLDIVRIGSEFSLIARCMSSIAERSAVLFGELNTHLSSAEPNSESRLVLERCSVAIGQAIMGRVRADNLLVLSDYIQRVFLEMPPSKSVSVIDAECNPLLLERQHVAK